MSKPDDQITYADVQEAAKVLLHAAGHATINEQRAMGEGNGKISTNEALGMAVRALTENAMVLQAMADHAEAQNG